MGKDIKKIKKVRKDTKNVKLFKNCGMVLFRKKTYGRDSTFLKR